MANLIKLGQGTYSNYAGLGTKDQYEVYFTTDTKQIFVGADEYTKGTRTLGAAPTEATPGNPGTLYAVGAGTDGGALYLCQGEGASAGTYSWVRVADINDGTATVESVAAGDGLETEDGQPITVSGTIKHSVPSGATAVVGPSGDVSAAFGSTFAVQSVNTDKFGHVTSSSERIVTMPTETAFSTTGVTGADQSLSYGSTFAVVTGVAKGTGSHEAEVTTTTFTLPASDDTTYTISSVNEGVVTLTPSSGEASTALINGWGDLAKKSDITAVFKYKGSVPTVADLPKAADVGDVYQVDAAEYVCITAGTGAEDPAVYELLGPIVDLSAYATTAYVQSEIETALTWKTF